MLGRTKDLWNIVMYFMGFVVWRRDIQVGWALVKTKFLPPRSTGGIWGYVEHTTGR